MAGSPIVLVGSFTKDEEQHWLHALRRAMPGEQLLLAEEVHDCGDIEVAIVANPDPVVISRFGSLKWVQSLWAGVEKLLAEPALGHLPVVRMVDPELARTMAEAVLAWTLYLHRDMPAYLAQQQVRKWRQLPYVAPSARRVGLLGLGSLGVAAARALCAADFAVQGWRRTPRHLEGMSEVAAFTGLDGLEDMVRHTDILVCLLPLTKQTLHLVDAALLQLMPARSCLVNFGRGALLNTPDLLAALDRGHLKHAVLDVFDEEPLPAQSPLWAHPGVTVLPHIAADTDSGTASLIVARNVQRWRESGQVPLSVDRQLGY